MKAHPEVQPDPGDLLGALAQRVRTRVVVGVRYQAGRGRQVGHGLAGGRAAAQNDCRSLY